jgi:type I restriction enzyme S subunit
MNKHGWTYKKLGEVCESELGKTLNSAKDTGKLYPYLCAVNVLWDRIDTSSLKETRFEKTELERYSVKKGDLLICEGGDIGRAAIWNKEQPIQYQNALHRVRFNNEVLPRFCLMYLRCLKEKGILDGRYGKGVTIKHLVKSSLLSIPIPVPPIAEQERIVAELDLLSGIIEKKKEQLKAYDQLAQSIFYTMFGDPIDNPKGWETKQLGKVCKTTSGGTPSKNHTEYYDGGTIPWLRSGEVSQGFIYNTELFITEEGLKCSSAKMIPIDTVVIAMYGATVGQVGIIKSPMCTNQAICSILPNDIFIPIYLYYFLLSKKSDYLKVAVGGAQPNISQGIIKETVIGIPPLSLQQEFAEKVEAIERQKALVQQSTDETQTMFDYTMDKYFE